jgi:HK97 family phage portal protein
MLTFDKALLDNGARPSGALIFEPVKLPDGSMQSAPQAVIEAAEKALQDQHVGAHRAGKSFVFGGNVKWEEMGISPKDMDFAKGKEDAARDICISFGVPHILIVPGQSTYNNVREAKLELWEDTILPMLDKATDALNAWLVPKFGEGLKLEPDLDSVSALEPRREAKRTSITTLLDKGVIDDAEAREALQYGPRPAGAVKLNRGDGQVLTALIQGATTDASMTKPLYRYLVSVGLLDAADTFEDFVAAWDSGQVDPAQLVAAMPADQPALPAPAGS